MTPDGARTAWPLRLVVLGPFVPAGSARDGADDVVEVDKDNFDEVLRRMVGRLTLEIAPRTAGGRAEQWVEVPIDNLRAFHPDTIVRCVPAAKAVSKPPAPDALASLLSMVDLPKGPEAPDERPGAFVRAILHHPEFRRVEALWRGLRFLVERTDFRAPIRILIGACEKADLPERIGQVAEACGAASGTEGDLLVAAAHEFGRSAADVAMLRSMAVAGEESGVPVLAGVAPGFLGRSAAEIERATSLAAVFDEPAYAEWRSLRSADASRWLTVVCNEWLARDRYGSGGIATRTFVFDEPVAADDPDEGLLWANPVWLLCERITRWFAESGWPFDVAGDRLAVVPDLPVRTVGSGPGAFASPVAWRLGRPQVDDLARAGGIAVFAAAPNTDAAVLPGVPTVHLPERYADAGETRLAARRATLPYQAFVARMSALAGLVLRVLPAGLRPEAVIEVFRNTLLLVVPSAEAIDVEVPASGERYQVALTIHPERIGMPLPAVHLQCAVPR